MKEKKKFAIYVRVSTDDQTVDNQIIPLKKHAERMDWDFQIFQETMTTRKTRPVKNEVYQALLHGEFDGLLLYKLDRWARSLRELITEMEVLINRKIEIHSMSEGFDFTSSMGQVMLAMIGAFAQLERDLIRERTLAGLERAKAQGKTLGRPKGAKDKGYRLKRNDRKRYSTLKPRKPKVEKVIVTKEKEWIAGRYKFNEETGEKYWAEGHFVEKK